jgi:uncharacterized protein YecT (DUF1311 family)
MADQEDGPVSEIAVFRQNRIEMSRLKIVLLAAALTAKVPVRAQHMNEKDSPCSTAVTTVELRSCFAKARDVADSGLDAVYKEIRARLDGEDATRLNLAQRLWVQYRDANCTAERELYAGGTAAPVVYLACLEAMTRTRTKELLATYAVRLK